MGPRYSYPKPPRQRIDARSQDIKEAGLRGVHRGMSGEVLSGIDETGKEVKFPQKPGTPASKPATVASTPAPTAPTASSPAGKFGPVKFGLGGDEPATGTAPLAAAPTAKPVTSGKTGFPASPMTTGNSK